MWSWSAMRDSGAPKSSSSLPWSARRPQASTTAPSRPSWSATLTSAEIYTPTLLCQAARLCSPALPREWPRSSPHLHPPQWRSRLLPPQRENTPYGSEAPSSHLCPPSSRCGSPRRSMTSQAHQSCTESASKVHHSTPPHPPSTLVPPSTPPPL